MQLDQNQYFTKVRTILLKKNKPQNKQNSQILSVLTLTLDSSVNFLFCLHFLLLKEQFESHIISCEKSFFIFALLQPYKIYSFNWQISIFTGTFLPSPYNKKELLSSRLNLASYCVPGSDFLIELAALF